MKDLKQRILEELLKGDRSPSQLYDALHLKKYRDLWAAVESLQSEGRIKSYFRSTPPSATLTYTITESELLKPVLSFWRQKSCA